MRFDKGLAGLLLLAAHLVAVPAARGAAAPNREGGSAPATIPADTVYRNGFVYTVDAQDSVQ